MAKSEKSLRPSRAAKKATGPGAAIGTPVRKSRERRTGHAAVRKHPGKLRPVRAAARLGSKLGILEALLRRESGMTIDDACRATGWQAHSVRGAIAGALKKRGLHVMSEKADGLRTYRIPGTAL